MAFHPYPQVIRPVFNLSRFGPPRDFTHASPCPWVDHSVSGLQRATVRPIQTRFRSGYTSFGLTLQHAITRWLIMQKARGRTFPEGHSAPTACRHRVSGALSLPSLGYFSPFPHGTGSLSVGRSYLALEDGPPRFRQGFSCPAVLGCPTQEDHDISHTRLSLAMAQLSSCVLLHRGLVTSRRRCHALRSGPTTPHMQR